MAIILVLSVVIAFSLKRTISRPLMLVSKQMKEIAEGEGDLTRMLPLRSKDEVGDLAKSFHKLMQNLRSHACWPCMKN